MNTEYNKTKDFLKGEELADELQVSVTTVYRLVTERKIPFFKVGRQIRFNLDKVKNSFNIDSIEDVYGSNKK
ncbi:hypothetical protein C0583_05970 [Candidatus Parcubacteria bacterium]|nr:MAG: hypothetical protein C0583_05970 [Candidatus Parcubacteria bacterium]